MTASTPYRRIIKVLVEVSGTLNAPGSAPAHLGTALARLAACIQQEQRLLAASPGGVAPATPRRARQGVRP